MLWLPSSARQNVINEREQYERAIMSMTSAHSRLEDWNRQLKEFSPYLELVKAETTAQHPALRPGYWHVIYRPPAGVPTLLVHEGPNGEYREPDSGLIEMLRRADLWSDRSIRERERLHRKMEAAKERRETREREARVEEVLARAKAAIAPGVSFANQGKGWSYRADAKKAA